MFFDWLMSAGPPGVITVLEHNFELDPKDFSVETMGRPGNHIPLHKPSGYRFLHDLGCTAETRKTEEAARDAMEKNMDDFISKFQYIGKRTDDYLRNVDSLGLVYYGKMIKKSAEKITSILQKKYNKEFEIIHVMEEGKEAPIDLPNITPLVVNNSSMRGKANSWMGSDESWSKAFEVIKTR